VSALLVAQLAEIVDLDGLLFLTCPIAFQGSTTTAARSIRPIRISGDPLDLFPGGIAKMAGATLGSSKPMSIRQTA
jgi:hypothetical protein